MFFSKKLIFLSLFILAAFFGYNVLAFFSSPGELDFASSKKIIINDNGLFFETETEAATVADLLKEKNIVIGDHDQIIPEKSSPLFGNENILIRRAIKIRIAADGNNFEAYTLANNIGGALLENKIILGRLDKASPNLDSTPNAKTSIVVTRINVEEKIITEDIDFKIIQSTDSKLGWREEKITQPGQKGAREVKYKITYKNGKEISRVALEKNITLEPVSQIVTKGTYMELGKANKGQGTWYAWRGGMFAASTTLPRGSYAKVTNAANGKSIVVQINDYGPQGKGRIIDLDKVAFAKIASLGAGVIGVKVEPVLN